MTLPGGGDISKVYDSYTRRYRTMTSDEFQKKLDTITNDTIRTMADEIKQLRKRAEAAEAALADSKKVQEVYRTLLVAGMREIVRLGDAPDKTLVAKAYYSHLFHLAQESGDLDKCDEAAIAAVAERAGVPIEYLRA